MRFLAPRWWVVPVGLDAAADAVDGFDRGRERIERMAYAKQAGGEQCAQRAEDVGTVRT